MIEDYEVTVKTIITSATRNALSILKLDRRYRRFSVFRTSGHPIDYDPLWEIDFFDTSNHLTWIKVRSPGYLVDEAWYTAEVIRLLKELIHNNN